MYTLPIHLRPSSEHHTCMANNNNQKLSSRHRKPRLTSTISCTTHTLLINTISGPSLALVVGTTLILRFLVIITIISWIPSLVIEANLLVGLDISSGENSEKGLVDISFVDVTGIKAAVGIAGVILSFRSDKKWLRKRTREWTVPRNV